MLIMVIPIIALSFLFCWCCCIVRGKSEKPIEEMYVRSRIKDNPIL